MEPYMYECKACGSIGPHERFDEHVDECSGGRCHGARWTRQGRIILYDGKFAVNIELMQNQWLFRTLSPVECDAIADFICKSLNATDLNEIVREWQEMS